MAAGRLTLREDWRERLAQLIDERRALPFAWGVRDCASLPMSAAIPAMTGQQVVFLEPYSTARGAARELRRLGGWRTAVSESLGLKPLPGVFAQHGDVVLVDVPGQAFEGQALGIVGEHGIYAQGPHGLVEVPAVAIRTSWPTGRLTVSSCLR